MAYLRVALTNLGKYNEGNLIFEWLELPATDEEIEKLFKNIGVEEGTEYEEYFITDYETDIPGLEIGEYENLSALNEQIEELGSLQDYEIEELKAIMETQGGTLGDALEIQQKGNFIYYSGVNSYEELAKIFVYDGLFGEIPEHLKNYIDYEAIGKELSYDYTQTENGMLMIA